MEINRSCIGLNRCFERAQLLGILVSVILSACVSSSKSVAPIASGTYQFQHRDAEFPTSQGFPVSVTINGFQVTVTNKTAGRSIPTGVIEEAKLMWHSKSGQWILGHDKTDAEASSVGGCGGEDPHTIDFVKREIWTCMGGF